MGYGSGLRKWKRYTRKCIKIRRNMAPLIKKEDPEPSDSEAKVDDQVPDIENQLPEQKEPEPKGYVRCCSGITIGILFVLCVAFIYFALSHGAGNFAGFAPVNTAGTTSSTNGATP